MLEPAIQVESISKHYRLGVRQFGSLREWLAGPRSDASGGGAKPDSLWALRDVSFSVAPGEAVGVIGANGAGKSTLLKILSRITEPTSGRARVVGHVGSLLEVGTGFHPELTGRENIYLNGAVLGMSRRAIAKHFDAIVAFAEIERFLETPLKYYSSGMYMRLAFGVAAHLDADVLLVDEVLAVGDAAFQKKCIAKMAEIRGAGRTILFVSHNLAATVEFCPRSLHIANGMLVKDGPTKEVAEAYLAQNAAAGRVDLRGNAIHRSGPGPMRLVSLSLEASDGRVLSDVEYLQQMVFRLGIQGEPGAGCILALAIRSAMGVPVVELNSSDDGASIDLQAAPTSVTVALPANPLNDGLYYVSVTLWNRFYQMEDSVESCLVFSSDTRLHGLNRSQGLIKMRGEWSVVTGPRDSHS